MNSEGIVVLNIVLPHKYQQNIPDSTLVLQFKWSFEIVFCTIFVCGHYLVQYRFCNSAFSTYSIGKLVFRLSALSVFSVCSVFRFHLHRLDNISIIIVYVGVRHLVILFPLYKKWFVIIKIVYLNKKKLSRKFNK